MFGSFHGLIPRYLDMTTVSPLKLTDIGWPGRFYRPATNGAVAEV